MIRLRRDRLLLLNCNFDLDKTLLPKLEHKLPAIWILPPPPVDPLTWKPPAHEVESIDELLGGVEIEDSLLTISPGAVGDHVQHDLIPVRVASQGKVSVGALLPQTVSDQKVKRIVLHSHYLALKTMSF